MADAEGMVRRVELRLRRVHHDGRRRGRVAVEVVLGRAVLAGGVGVAAVALLGGLVRRWRSRAGVAVSCRAATGRNLRALSKLATLKSV